MERITEVIATMGKQKVGGTTSKRIQNVAMVLLMMRVMVMMRVPMMIMSFFLLLLSAFQFLVPAFLCVMMGLIATIYDDACHGVLASHVPSWTQAFPVYFLAKGS